LSDDFFRALARRAAQRYRGRGRYARHFAFGKLMHDPFFRHVLEHGLIPPRTRVLDLGCGQGLLAALLEAARERTAAGEWPADWPAATAASIHGIDLLAQDVERARVAGGPGATFDCADIRTSEFGTVDLVVMLDVAHYMDETAQDDVVRRARSALAGGGTLLLRVADASGSLRFRLTLAADRVAMRLRGARAGRYHCRTIEAWKRCLGETGFRVEARPMSAGTPFANVLLVGRC
jgi:SAM-dependent methyltransferase